MAVCAVADWHKRITLFIPVCFVSPDDNTALPTNDKTYVFEAHPTDQRYKLLLVYSLHYDAMLTAYLLSLVNCTVDDTHAFMVYIGSMMFNVEIETSDKMS